MDTIPPGYQLHIVSCENDADNYNIKILSGLTKEDVQFYIHFLSYFKTSDPYGNQSFEPYGNKFIDHYPDAEKIAITTAYEKYPPTTPTLIEDLENSIEYWKTSDYSCEWVDDTIGIWNEGENYRVFDSYEVYLVNTPIPNVTGEFVDSY